MPIDATNPMTVPGQSEATYSSVRLANFNIIWPNPKLKKIVTYDLVKCVQNLDGSYTDAPKEFVDAQGHPAKVHRVIPDFDAYVKEAVAAGDTEIAVMAPAIDAMAQADAVANLNF